MGHMLKTVNPEAVEHIGTLHEESAVGAAVGDIVVYRPRVGERRGGRDEFPAMVMGHRDDGSLDLIVFRDADDVIAIQHVHLATDAEPFNAWRPCDRNVLVEPFEPSRLNAMAKDIGNLRRQVFGDFLDPPQPIMEILDGFGKRIKALEKAAKPKK